jgi:hypothetical protein
MSTRGVFDVFLTTSLEGKSFDIRGSLGRNGSSREKGRRGVCPAKGWCVQREVSLAKVKVRNLVAWIAGRREINFLKPIDKAIFKDGEQVIGPQRK